MIHVLNHTVKKIYNPGVWQLGWLECVFSARAGGVRSAR